MEEETNSGKSSSSESVSSMTSLSEGHHGVCHEPEPDAGVAYGEVTAVGVEK